MKPHPHWLFRARLAHDRLTAETRGVAVADGGCECAIEHPGAHSDRDGCRSEREGLICSRPADHDGQHVACSIGQHPVASWSDSA